MGMGSQKMWGMVTVRQVSVILVNNSYIYTVAKHSDFES